MDSNQVRREWAERSGEYSPAYYAYYGPNETSESVRGLLDRFLDRDAEVLELGYGSGRHLAHLYQHGYEHLTGIEVNPDAYEVLAETHPNLAAAGTFHLDAIEDVVETFDDGQFDAVFSVETLQHLHPEADWVFEELVRITSDLLITVENEGGPDSTGGAGADVNYVNGDFPLYYRNWNQIFTALGLEEVETESGDRDTLRAFRPTTD